MKTRTPYSLFALSLLLISSGISGCSLLNAKKTSAVVASAPATPTPAPKATPTASPTGPTLVSLTPNTGYTNPSPTTVVATFSQAVNPLTSTFFVITGTCNTLPTISGVVMSAGGTVATATMTGTSCDEDQNWAVTLDPTTVTNLDGLPGTGSIDKETYTYRYCGGDALTRTPYAGGSGSDGDPYTICTATQLNHIGDIANNTNLAADLAASFELRADIDLTGITYNPIGNYFDGSTPGGGIGFTGNFEGNNHTISNLTFSDASRDQVGLFGWIHGFNKTISNIHVVNATVTGHYSVGALAGYVQLSAITHCSSSGSITASDGTGQWSTGAVGGLIGVANGTAAVISNSYSTATVTSTTGAYVGGLIGFMGSNVNNCYASGTVNGNDSAGGLIGYHEGDVTNSYSIGTVTGSTNLGGFIGSNAGGTASGCYYDDSDPSGGVGTGTLGGSVSGVTPANTNTMQSVANYTIYSWDQTVWSLANGQFPSLK